MNISADLIGWTDLNSANSTSTDSSYFISIDYTTPMNTTAIESTKSPHAPCTNNTITMQCFYGGECYTKSYIDGSGNIKYTPFCMYVFSIHWHLILELGVRGPTPK